MFQGLANNEGKLNFNKLLELLCKFLQFYYHIHSIYPKHTNSIAQLASLGLK